MTDDTALLDRLGFVRGAGRSLSFDGPVLYAQPDGSVALGHPMFFNPEMRQCVVYICARNKHGEVQTFGTGFVVSEAIAGTDDHWHTLVTSRHVIEEVRLAATDEYTYIVVNSDDGGRSSVAVAIADWLHHPRDIVCEPDDYLHLPPDQSRRTDEVFDVAVAPCPRAISDRACVVPHDLDGIMTDDVVQAQFVGPGDDLLVAGLYHQHPGELRNVPIVRSGIIAAMPEEPVQTRIGRVNGYLAELRSTTGLSGAPVFWVSGAFRADHENERFGWVEMLEFRLLGLVLGHFRTMGITDWLNDGIAIVVPVSAIMETLHQEDLMGPRKAAQDAKQPREGDTDMALDAQVEDRVTLSGIDPEDALRALLKTPPHGQTQDPA